MTCEVGEQCDVDDDGKARCSCIDKCPYEEGPRVQVRDPGATRTGEGSRGRLSKRARSETGRLGKLARGRTRTASDL